MRKSVCILITLALFITLSMGCAKTRWKTMDGKHNIITFKPRVDPPFALGLDNDGYVRWRYVETQPEPVKSDTPKSANE